MQKTEIDKKLEQKIFECENCANRLNYVGMSVYFCDCCGKTYQYDNDTLLDTEVFLARIEEKTYQPKTIKTYEK